jgi:hypothetical protein
MIDGPTYGTAADTNPLGEVYTIRHPEPAFEPDDWPSRTEIYEETSP